MKKKNGSIRRKLIGVIIPLLLVMVISYFALARNIVQKISLDRMQAKSQVYTEELNGWVNQIFSELEIYKNTIEEGNFENDEEVLSYMETTVDKNEAYSVACIWVMTVVFIWMVPDGSRVMIGYW